MKKENTQVTKLRNSALLLLTSLIWGVAFVAQSEGMNYVGPCTFVCSRFFLAFLVLFPIVLFRRKKRLGTLAPYPLTVKAGILCGLALGSASLFQQYGIMTTSVGKSGFITSLYIIIVPILGIFLKRKIPFIVWIGAAIAAVGMYLLCMTESLRIQSGDILVFACAIVFSIQILFVDTFNEKGVDGIEMSCLQFLTAGCIGLLGTIFFEKPTLANIQGALIPVLYAGLLSSAVGYTLQIIGQKGLNPTIAALLMSLESVFSVLAGWVLLGQVLSRKELLGCALTFTAVILVQIPFPERKKTD